MRSRGAGYREIATWITNTLGHKMSFMGVKGVLVRAQLAPQNH